MEIAISGNSTSIDSAYFLKTWTPFIWCIFFIEFTGSLNSSTQVPGQYPIWPFSDTFCGRPIQKLLVILIFPLFIYVCVWMYVCTVCMYKLLKLILTAFQPVHCVFTPVCIPPCIYVCGDLPVYIPAIPEEIYSAKQAVHGRFKLQIRQSGNLVADYLVIPGTSSVLHLGPTVSSLFSSCYDFQISSSVFHTLTECCCLFWTLSLCVFAMCIFSSNSEV